MWYGWEKYSSPFTMTCYNCKTKTCKNFRNCIELDYAPTTGKFPPKIVPNIPQKIWDLFPKMNFFYEGFNIFKQEKKERNF